MKAFSFMIWLVSRTLHLFVYFSSFWHFVLDSFSLCRIISCITGELESSAPCSVSILSLLPVFMCSLSPPCLQVLHPLTEPSLDWKYLGIKSASVFTMCRLLLFSKQYSVTIYIVFSLFGFYKWPWDNLKCTKDDRLCVNATVLYKGVEPPWVLVLVGVWDQSSLNPEGQLYLPQSVFTDFLFSWEEEGFHIPYTL